MSYACPVSFEKVDSTVSRISSLIVSVFVIYYLYSLNLYILYFLFLDFFMRVFCQKKLSLIHISSKLVKKVFALKDKNSDAAAKKLAGIFGIFFILILIPLHQFGLGEVFSYIIGGIFILCSLADVFLDYCVGCKIYYIIKKIYPSFMS